MSDRGEPTSSASIAAPASPRPGRVGEVQVKLDPSATATLSPGPSEDRSGGLVLVVVSEGERRELPLPANGEVTIGRADDADVCILHGTLSRYHARLTVGEALTICDLGSKNGTRLRGEVLVRGVPRPLVPGNELVPGDIFEPGALVCFVKAPARRPLPRRPPSRELPAVMPHAAAKPSALVAPSPPLLLDGAMVRIYSLLERVARGDISVLLLGETGVGKEVAARTVHERSRRAAGPFVALNCAALSPSLLESELFGHEKGAFTGALAAKEGLFEAARGGTVFLDEVGELPAAVQATLLRVLEERTVTRVGATRARPVDVRLVAATNRDLDEEVERRAFRRDLFFRLNGVSVEIPPLRERREEILPLASRFLSRARGGGVEETLAAEVASALKAWEWPGNVRELKNVMERAALLAGDAPLRLEHLGLRSGSPLAPEPVPISTEPAGPLRSELSAIERTRILDALTKAGGNQTRAAAALGMPRRTFILRLEAYAVPRPRRR